MAKNPYKVLTRPATKKADIIRATLPNVNDVNHVYATCATREQAIEFCRLLNLGLEIEAAGQVVALPKKRKARAR